MNTTAYLVAWVEAEDYFDAKGPKQSPRVVAVDYFSEESPSTNLSKMASWCLLERDGADFADAIDRLASMTASSLHLAWVIPHLLESSRESTRSFGRKVVSYRKRFLVDIGLMKLDSDRPQRG